MIVRSIDQNNDWTFGKGKSDYKADVLAVAQIIKTRLQSFLADCWFALSEGIDWFNLLGSKKQLDLRLAISRTIIESDGVKSLVEVDFKYDAKRKITITYSVITVYGDLSASEELELLGA